eukprot:5958838-Pleurochrysis_carterae.AAC.1
MTRAYDGVRVALPSGARSCQASDAQVSGNSSHKLRCMSRWSALVNAHKPWRAALGCVVETRSKKGARHPRIK